MAKFRKIPSKTEAITALKRGDVSFPPFSVTLRPEEEYALAEGRADAVLELAWGARSRMFAIEYKTSSTPAMIRFAAQEARRLSRPPLLWPMVLCPYLSEERLEELEREGVSGLDLCGNGVVTVPGEWLVRRAGKPNLYPQSFPIKNIFRGTSSLVARVLLRPGWLNYDYGAVSEIRKEIENREEEQMKRREGVVALSTVSKVLARMEEELIVGRQSGPIRLLQPDKLLQRLVENYRPPKVTRRFLGKTRLGTQASALVDEQLDWARQNGVCLAFTGMSSAEQYVSMPRDPTISLYCTDVAALLERLGGNNVREQDRFFDLELLETDDRTVYFDLNRKMVGRYPFAPPLQSYLELATAGKREQDTAEQLKRLLWPDLMKPAAGRHL
jgi:hypothetical protein